MINFHFIVIFKKKKRSKHQIEYDRTLEYLTHILLLPSLYRIITVGEG